MASKAYAVSRGLFSSGAKWWKYVALQLLRNMSANPSWVMLSELDCYGPALPSALPHLGVGSCTYRLLTDLSVSFLLPLLTCRIHLYRNLFSVSAFWETVPIYTRLRACTDLDGIAASPSEESKRTGHSMWSNWRAAGNLLGTRAFVKISAHCFSVFMYDKRTFGSWKTAYRDERSILWVLLTCLSFGL